MERFILSKMLPGGELKDVYSGGSFDLLEKALKEEHDDKSTSAYYILQSLGDGPDGMNITKRVFRYKDGQMNLIQEFCVTGIDPRLLEPWG